MCQALWYLGPRKNKVNRKQEARDLEKGAVEEKQGESFLSPQSTSIPLHVTILQPGADYLVTEKTKP